MVQILGHSKYVGLIEVSNIRFTSEEDQHTTSTIVEAPYPSLDFLKSRDLYMVANTQNR